VRARGDHEDPGRQVLEEFVRLAASVRTTLEQDADVAGVQGGRQALVRDRAP
jgi:hypothetical protein